MNQIFNPFEYEAANKLSPDQVLQFYIEDFNYSRFVRSKRNVFLVGERGAGKTMTLLYNSLPVQIRRSKETANQFPLDLVCVYVPCNTPLTDKTEYALLEDFQAAVISEHFLVISIMFAIADTLGYASDLLTDVDENAVRNELEFLLQTTIPRMGDLFSSLKSAFQRENVSAQKAINAKALNSFYEEARSFTVGVMPLITSLRKIPRLQQSHFVLMIDDAQELNTHQSKALNSWISYRDNSLFSFKVATTKVGQHEFITAAGGTILEGHDFTLVDMELPYQNKYSNFGKLAREVVQRRLENIGATASDPESFFPTNLEFEKDLVEAEKQAAGEADKLFPNGTPKQKKDYVYRHARAAYFRNRSARANRPPYSGFDILVHISTGVVRNLLEPCYWMFDKVVSEQRGDETVSPIREIPPSVQTEIILERSKKKWDWLRDGLDKSIVGCSRTDAVQIYNLFDNLAVLFRERLLRHKSEPRAIAFTISERDHANFPDLLRLFDVSRKAQLLYTYTSSAKDSGRREVYYVPNRMLWPDRGLDPHGQHARVSLRARDLWAAASQNTKLPFSATDEAIPIGDELELF
jgi:hypothetical protein